MNTSNNIFTMKTIKNSAIVALLTVLLVGCSDFGNMNVDPNNPSQAKTELLLTDAQKTLGTYVSRVHGTLYVQYIAETQYTDASRYGDISFNWNFWYTGALNDFQTIIDLNTDEETKDQVLSGGSNANQIAVSTILKTYLFHTIADRWGMIPYSEALEGRDNLRPAYDPMPDIYQSMIDNLKSAVDMMSGDPVTGDILFNGDMGRWARFANSLRARIALRMSEANASLAESEFTDAVSDGLITENVMFPFLAEAANENPWFSRFRTRTDYALAKPIADTMKGLNDLRVLKFGDPAPNFDDGDGVVEMNEIRGMPYGIENAGDITNADISFPGQAIRAQDAPLSIITLAEMHFAQAEAIERGWMTGSAQAQYESGIEESWRQWDVYDATAYGNYISDPDVDYTTGTWQERIGFQKWIANFPQGYEGWAEWRRLGYPQLTPAPDALNSSGQIPVRQGYPTSESQLNSENYEAAVSAQGEDGLDTNIWWDN